MSARTRASRPLDDATRRRAWLAAAPVVVIAVVAIATLAPHDRAAHISRPQSVAGRASPRTIVGGPTPAQSPVRSTPTRAHDMPRRPPHAIDADARTAAVATARRFLDALLDYQRGHTTPRERAILRANATGTLAYGLLAQPPRLPATPVARGRIASLELDDSATMGAASLSATIDRAGHLTPLALALRRHGDRWLVYRVG